MREQYFASSKEGVIFFERGDYADLSDNLSSFFPVFEEIKKSVYQVTLIYFQMFLNLDYKLFLKFKNSLRPSDIVTSHILILSYASLQIKTNVH